jgi:hypothetical protein
MYRCMTLPFLLLLNACDSSEHEPGPGGVSVEDAKALDQAAEKLDGQAADPEK